MQDDLILIGWREWISLPKLGISRIKAKIDTGARTSALHAFEVNVLEVAGIQKVRFALHPRRFKRKVIYCETDLLGQRWVTDSGGHRDLRYVIQTELIMGNRSSLIEVTLTCREDMLFRVLLGRRALQSGYRIDPAASYLLKKQKHLDYGL